MQRRWFCFGCLREWLYAVKWTEGDPCPLCQHADVMAVEYRPGFVGADVPREADGRPSVASTRPSPVWVDVPPSPMVLMPQTWEGDGA